MATTGSIYNFGNNLGNFSNYSGATATTGGINWGVLAGAGLEALAGYADSKEQAAATRASIAQNAAELQKEAANQRQLAVDKADLNYYYNRLNKERKRTGLSQFRQFKSSYAQDTTGV